MEQAEFEFVKEDLSIRNEVTFWNLEQLKQLAEKHLSFSPSLSLEQLELFSL